MFKYLKSNLWGVCVTCILLFCQQGAIVFTSARSANTLNALISLRWTPFIQAILIQFAGWVAFWVFAYFGAVSQEKTIQTINTTIRVDVLGGVTAQEFSQFHEKPIGTYESWLSNDINTVDQAAFANFFDLTASLFGAGIAIFTLFFYSIWIGIATLVLTGLMMLIPMLFSKPMNRVGENATKENEHFMSVSDNMLKAYDVYKSFNVVGNIVNKIRAASLSLKDVMVKQTRMQAIVAVLGFAGNIVSNLALLLLTGYLAIARVLTIGTVDAVGSLSTNIFNTLGNLSNHFASIASTKSIFAKFAAVEDRPRQAGQKLPADEPLQYTAQGLVPTVKNNAVTPPLAFTFAQHGKYMLVGPSGSGKTTFLKVLSGQNPEYTGSVTLGGVELKALDPALIRDHVIYLSQDYHILAGSIRSNILLDENYSDTEVRRALTDAGGEMLLPRLDADAGEDGNNLSGGEKQRIALARGFLRHKDIVFSDESTSGLQTEMAIAIERTLVLNPNIMVVMVTHQPFSEIEAMMDRVYTFPEDLAETGDSPVTVPDVVVE